MTEVSPEAQDKQSRRFVYLPTNAEDFLLPISEPTDPPKTKGWTTFSPAEKTVHNN